MDLFQILKETYDSKTLKESLLCQKFHLELLQQSLEGMAETISIPCAIRFTNLLQLGRIDDDGKLLVVLNLLLHF